MIHRSVGSATSYQIVSYLRRDTISSSQNRSCRIKEYEGRMGNAPKEKVQSLEFKNLKTNLSKSEHIFTLENPYEFTEYELGQQVIFGNIGGRRLNPNPKSEAINMVFEKVLLHKPKIIKKKRKYQKSMAQPNNLQLAALTNRMRNTNLNLGQLRNARSSLISATEIDDTATKWKNSLIGKIVHKDVIDSEAVQKEINIIWRKYKRVEINTMVRNLFVFKFKNKEHKKEVYKRIPWVINYMMVVLHKYDNSIPLENYTFKHHIFSVIFCNLALEHTDDGIIEKMIQDIGQMVEVEGKNTEEEEVLKVSSLIFISSSLRRTGNQGIEGFQQWLTFNVAEIYRKLEVILTTSVENLGKAGETVKVAPGYFRNDWMPDMFPVPDIEKYAYLIREQHKETVPLVSAGVNDRGEICCIKKLHPAQQSEQPKKNIRKQGVMPIPAHILLRVRELAENHSQAPLDLCGKVGGGIEMEDKPQSIQASINLLLRQTPKKLPPGPYSIPIITSLQWLRKPLEAFEPTLRNLKAKYGPIITLSIGHQKSIFITNSSLAHQALIQNGAIFADRPPAPVTSKIVSSNQHVISEASYGPLWRLLRKNLTVQILHPSKIKSFAPVRKRVLNIIKESIKKESNSGLNPVLVVDYLQFGMFCLLVFMCFGEKLDEEKIRQVESVQTNLLLGLSRFEILNFFPEFMSKIIFRKIWQNFDNLRMDHENVLIPLIRSRQEEMKKTSSKNHQDDEKSSLGLCYVDSLLNLEIPDEEGGSRKLSEKEVVSLCREFLDAGTDTTTAALEWIMANLVKYQDIQSKLYDEIRKISDDDDEIQEEDLKKLPYLKAVILEGLRIHPPGHFVLNHAVTQDVGLDGYVVPKEAIVNFMVAQIGRDPKVWGEDSMVFKPERFMNEDDVGSVNEEMSDLTGNKEIKMIPFGAGRRMCPASGLAMLILEYFVANLIKEFKWTPKAGDDIDLSEKQDFITMVMKNPLWAHVSVNGT
ncbi:hypothetical protein MKW98_011491 [Papaver atlanticum]|uniref:Cytochrome P450 n=1 Tax=Papaver atlanticum TaxID=357466 RepID=A0AAD4SNW7_9MAGN|nr:hypothetical protein MKW98_011491 [Papaver atlanticum]